MTVEQTRDVVICPQCKGAGQVYRLSKDGTPYMLHGQPVLEFCPVCDGEGRLIRVTTVEYMRIPTNIVDEDTSGKKQSVFNKIRDRIQKK